MICFSYQVLHQNIPSIHCRTQFGPLVKKFAHCWFNVLVYLFVFSRAAASHLVSQEPQNGDQQHGHPVLRRPGFPPLHGILVPQHRTRPARPALFNPGGSQWDPLYICCTKETLWSLPVLCHAQRPDGAGLLHHPAGRWGWVELDHLVYHPAGTLL